MMRTISTLSTLLIATGLLLHSPPQRFVVSGVSAGTHASQAGKAQAVTEEVAGLRRVVFTTERGNKVYVNLTDDLTPGSRVSGTVFAEAAGKLDAERAENLQELKEQFIEIAGLRVPAIGKTFELSIPASLPRNTIDVVLRDKIGREIAKAVLAVAPRASVPATSVKLPAHGQAGSFIEIECPCDGVIRDTDYVKVAGNSIPVVAKSSRKIVAYDTSGEQGLRKIEVSEREQVTRGEMSLVATKLSVGKEVLMSGERTTLTLEVTGLEGLRTALHVRIENRTPYILTMEPSNVEEIVIHPSDVRPGGRYTAERRLLGNRYGHFDIRATVVKMEEPPPAPERPEPTPVDEAGLREKLSRHIEVVPPSPAATALATPTPTATPTPSPTQCDLSDDFSSPAPWTQYGTRVNVSGGTGNFNSAPGAADERIVRQLSPAGRALDNAEWTADVDFTPGTSTQAGHSVLSFTSGSLNPYRETPTGPYTNQDFIEVTYFSPLASLNPGKLHVGVKDGANPAQVSASGVQLPAYVNVSYYLRLRRNNNTATLSVFSDPARTIPVGAPLNFTFVGTITGLTHVQIGSIIQGHSNRRLRAKVDNLCVRGLETDACDLAEDYSSNGNWTQVNTLVSISAGAVMFNNATDGDNTERRVHRPLNGVVQNSNTWRADFDFRPTGVGSGGPGHTLLALTAGTLDTFSDINYNPTNQDAVAATWGSTNHTSDPTTFMLEGRAKNGNGNWSVSQNGILLAVGTQYYITLERLGEFNGRVSAFTDAARTQHVNGSPQCFTIPAGVGNLDVLQHGTVTWGGNDRALTATLDNTCIRAGVLDPGAITYSSCPSGIPTVIGSARPASGGSWGWTYQWEQSVGCNGTWTAIPGATGLTYQLASALTSKTCYRRKALGACAVALYTNVATLNASQLVADAGADKTVCSCSGPQKLQIGSPPVAGVTYSWSPAAGLDNPTLSNPTIDFSAFNGTPVAFPSVYEVTATDANGCTAKDSVYVKTVCGCRPAAKVTVTPPTMCSRKITLTADCACGGATATYLWSPGGATTASIEVPGGAGPYTVTCRNECGATVSQPVVVPTVNPLEGGFPNLQCPNIFTPNGYNGNDSWLALDTSRPPGVTPAYNATEYQLEVFDRWGLRVALLSGSTTTGFANESIPGWNGTATQDALYTWWQRTFGGRKNTYAGQPVSDGTYFYIFRLRNCTTGWTDACRGFVTVLR